MSSPAVYPKFRAFDPSTGGPLVGGKLSTFVAGTATPLATYSDAGLTVPNANPVILDAAGEANIYVGPTAYKFVLTKSDNTAVWTFDNYAPNLAFPSPTPSGWVQFTTTPVTFVNATTFSTTGDATATLLVGRRVRATVTAGTVYATIKSSSFAAGVTTVQVITDSGALDSGLSAVFYGLETILNPSYFDPRSFVTAGLAADITGFAGRTQVTTFNAALDALGEFVAGVFTAKYPGNYLFSFQAEVSDTAAAVKTTVSMNKSGTDVAEAAVTSGAANVFNTITIQRPLTMLAGDTIKFFIIGAATTTLRAGVATCTMFNAIRFP